MVDTFIVYGPRKSEFYVHVGDDGGIAFASAEIEQFTGRDWLPVKKKFEEAFKWKVEAVARVSAAPNPRPAPRPADVESEEPQWRFPQSADDCRVWVDEWAAIEKQIFDAISLSGAFSRAFSVQPIRAADFYASLGRDRAQHLPCPSRAPDPDQVQRRASDLEVADPKLDGKLDVGARERGLQLAPERDHGDGADTSIIDAYSHLLGGGQKFIRVHSQMPGREPDQDTDEA
jgi:hypothetical protein